MGVSVYPDYTSDEFWLNVSEGKVPGCSVVKKFGRNPAVASTFEAVTEDAFYNTPQVASATTLRVKAGNTNDTAAGTGAREITLQGLDETGALVEETLATAGTSASSTTTATFIRLFRAYVSASGTYATTVTGSHAADIVIENGAGGTDWLTIDSGDYEKSQSNIGAYTVPLGKKAYVNHITMHADSSQSADFAFFQRRNILESAAPYSAMREVFYAAGVVGAESKNPKIPLGPFPALTDLIFLAKASNPSEVSVTFDILLIDT